MNILQVSSLRPTSILSALATVATLSSFAPAAQAFTFSLSEGCPALTCVDLDTAGYTLTQEGAVIAPATSKLYRYLEPGTDSDLTTSSNIRDQVKSYNVTSKVDVPPGAIDAIIVAELNGIFEFLWGSVDTFNHLEFYSGDTLVAALNGFELAQSSQWSALAASSSQTGFWQAGDTAVTNTVNAYNSAGNYGVDVFAAFRGDFDSVKLFNAASTAPSVNPETGVTLKESQVAFEVAAASVPEPTGLLGGLMALGAVGLLARRQAS